MKKRVLTFVLITFMLSSLLSGCSCTGLRQVISTDPILEYHGMIDAYENAQLASFNGESCVALTYSQLEINMQLFNNYLISEVNKTKVYRDALATYGKQKEQAQQAYTKPDGTPLQPNEIDLNELAKAKATPADMAEAGRSFGLSITAYVSTFTEAQLAVIPPETLSNTQRLIMDSTNHTMACIEEWNAAVTVYNKERSKIPGTAVAALAKWLKVKDLPERLPLYKISAAATPPKATPIAPRP